MTFRAATDATVAALLGSANHIDELATDLELGRGRVTVIGRLLKLGAMVTAAAAIPVVILDFLTGGPAARKRDDEALVQAG